MEENKVNLEKMSNNEIKSFHTQELVTLHSLCIYASVVNSLGDFQKGNTAASIIQSHQLIIDDIIKEIDKRKKENGQEFE